MGRKSHARETKYCRGCGGSMVVHQTVKPAVSGSNPASLQPAGTCHSLLGNPVGIKTAGWPLMGGRGKNNTQKYQKNYMKKKKIIIITIKN